jgi:hypothetical protein
MKGVSLVLEDHNTAKVKSKITQVKRNQKRRTYTLYVFNFLYIVFKYYIFYIFLFTYYKFHEITFVH